MSVTELNKNRIAFPLEELEKYAGKWVAFDPTCTKIVAADEDPAKVYDFVVAAGFDPQEVWFEGLPDDAIHGGMN